MGVAGQADLTSLLNNLSGASEGVDRAAAMLVSKVAEQVKVNAVALAPRKTGTLANSIQVRYESSTKAIIEPSVPYGKYLEFGTKGPYKISPRKPGGVLHFKVDGKWVYAKSVMHPGIKAQPYMRPALEQALGDKLEELTKSGALLIVKGNIN